MNKKILINDATGKPIVIPESEPLTPAQSEQFIQDEKPRDTSKDKPSRFTKTTKLRFPIEIQNANGTMIRTCGECGQWFPREEFRTKKSFMPGCYCKNCKKKVIYE